MKIIAKTGSDKLASVYLAETQKGKLVEFVESITPPLTRNEKWVLIVSTLAGCPVSCKFCDAGGSYMGRLSCEEIFEQIDYLVQKFFPKGKIDTKKFKIQFSRMGEPALNPEVLKVLEALPDKYNTQGLLPSVSTVALRSAVKFFEELKSIKDRLYRDNFQMQFSIHSTNEAQRDWLIPLKKWNFGEISEYGSYFYKAGDKKIALNFAVNNESIVDVDIITKYFPAEIFMLKITPINPTVRSFDYNIDTKVIPEEKDFQFIEILRKQGYQVLINIGELEENDIGSNCGQLLSHFMKSSMNLDRAYNYRIEKYNP